MFYPHLPLPDKKKAAEDHAHRLRIGTVAALGVPYHITNDGTITIRGDVVLPGPHYKVLPDLAGVVVEGDFTCAGNELRSLKGAPRVTGTFDCRNNKLDSLESAPDSFGRLLTDFGDFSTPADIPDALRRPAPPSVALGAPIRVRRPLSLVPKR